MRVIRFYKPYGVLTKFTDEEHRPTLADYIDIPDIYAVGRLDMDSEGLLLLTDDGTLAYRLTDPAYAHPRTYWVQVERVPDEEALDRLRKGVILGDYITRPAEATLIEPQNIPERTPPIRSRKTVPTAWIALTLTEGRNRQIRHMTAAVGHPTLRIIRMAIGSVDLDGLTPGHWSSLTPAQIEALRRSVNVWPRG